MRRILGVICVTVVLLCLASCSHIDDGEELEKFESLVEELNSEGTDVVAAEPFADKVYIIIPKSASAKLKAKAVELSAAIHSKTEVESIVKYDYEDVYVYEDDLLIFLGKTDKMPSTEAAALLRRGEYVCKWSKQDIVIASRDDEAAVAAIDEFIKTVIPGSSNASLMSEGAHFEHKVDYDVSAVTINGYDLYDFTLVCTEDIFEKVKVLNQYIVKRSGYLMDVSFEGSDVEGKTISFVCDPDISGAVIEQVGQDIQVRAADEYRLSAAIADFAARLFGNISDGVAGFAVSEKYEISSFNKSLKICSAYYLNDGTPYLEQITKMSQAIQEKGFDIIVFGELNAESYDDIDFNLTDNYGVVKTVAQDGRIFCAVYRKAAFDSISCDFSQDIFSVDITASGEDISRRVIRVSGADTEALDAVLDESDTYDLVLFDRNTSDALCQSLELKTIGEHNWSFGGESFACGLLAEPALENVSEKTEVIKEAGRGYMNLFVYADIFVEYCAEFEALKNAVN